MHYYRNFLHRHFDELILGGIFLFFLFLINYVYQKCVEGDVLWEETVIIITECINSLWKSWDVWILLKKNTNR